MARCPLAHAGIDLLLPVLFAHAGGFPRTRGDRLRIITRPPHPRAIFRVPGFCQTAAHKEILPLCMICHAAGAARTALATSC